MLDYILEQTEIYLQNMDKGLSQVKVGNDFIYFLSIILQSISIVALPKFDH